MAVSEHDLIIANENERLELQKIDGVLANSSKQHDPRSIRPLPKLVSPDGDEIELPLLVFQVLKQIIYHLMRGRAISIVPINKELSTQEAADILNVSRPYLVGLLEDGKIPFIKVGTHRRIRFSDLIKYREYRDEKRKQGLAEIARISEEEGLYD